MTMAAQTDAVPLTDLEAAHLPDTSSARSPTRPPSYMEQDMEEPLPTYKEAAKRKMKAVQQYPAARVPSKRGRYLILFGFSLLIILVIAIPAAVVHTSGNNNGNNVSTVSGNVN